MADIRPFRGIRPRPDRCPDIAAPPYDVMDFEEGRTYVKDRPYSFLRVEKSEIELDPSLHVHDSRIFENGARNLERLLQSGMMIRDPRPSLYIYQQRMGDHVQAGVVAGASVDEYESGRIKIHEHTREVKEKERTLHVHTVGANTGPVFLTYPAKPEIDALVNQVRSRPPTVDFTSEDGVGHTLWVVEEPVETTQLVELFSTVPFLYVADGHHRSAAACNVRKLRKSENKAHNGQEPYNYFLSVIFPHDQMKIMEYNRVVKDLNGLDHEEFLQRIASAFEVADLPTARPSEPKTFGLYLGRSEALGLRWYQLRARPGTFPASDPVRSLDVAILQDNLLAPVLGIQNPRTDERIEFVGGIRGVAELERRARRHGGVAFCLYPTSISQLMSVADAGQVMPPKSTWFEPKLRSGMVVRSINDD